MPMAATGTGPIVEDGLWLTTPPPCKDSAESMIPRTAMTKMTFRNGLASVNIGTYDMVLEE